MSSLKKMVVAAVASAALVTGLVATTAPAAAAPGLTVAATSTSNGVINYKITNVPQVVNLPPLPAVPGSCATYLIDAIRALPVIAPRFLDSGSDAGTMNLAGTLPALIAIGAVAGGITGGQLKIADGTGTIQGAFAGVGMGVWIVGTVCNLNKFANSAPVLVGPGTGSLAAGSLGAGMLATGSSAS